jgi:hypothetical protein
MPITKEEQQAVSKTLEYGKEFGYGNLIAHLRKAWAVSLIKNYGFDIPTATRATIVDPYPIEVK